MSQRYYKFFESKVNEQLMRAHIQRKQCSAKLYKESEWSQFKLPNGIPVMKDSSSFIYVHKYIPILPREWDTPTRIYSKLVEYKKSITFQMMQINTQYPALAEILNKWKGKVVLAGGCFTSQWLSKDIDLYFINCSDDEMDAIIHEAYKFIDGYHPCEKKTIEVMKDITNIQLVETISGDSSIYQFIKKSYNSIASILWNFDMYGSMIAYDGKEIWATDVGAWAYENLCNVVDVSWISPYFRLRFEKYCSSKNFTMVLPCIQPWANMNCYVILQHYNTSCGIKTLGEYFFKTLDRVKGGISLALRYDEDEDLEYASNGRYYRVYNKSDSIRSEYPKSNIRLTPREFSSMKPHKMYFVSPEVDKLLYLARRFSKDSILRLLPKDVFVLILHHLIFDPDEFFK
jgi:hypothetical protein